MKNGMISDLADCAKYIKDSEPTNDRQSHRSSLREIALLLNRGDIIALLDIVGDNIILTDPTLPPKALHNPKRPDVQREIPSGSVPVCRIEDLSTVFSRSTAPHNLEIVTRMDEDLYLILSRMPHKLLHMKRISNKFSDTLEMLRDGTIDNIVVKLNDKWHAIHE